MTSAETFTEPDLLCLPGDVINDIASWLDEEDLCSFELANKRIHTISSNPSHPGPGKRELDLLSTFDPDARSETRAYSPKALRSPTHLVNLFLMQHDNEMRHHSVKCLFAQHMRIL